MAFTGEIKRSLKVVADGLEDICTMLGSAGEVFGIVQGTLKTYADGSSRGEAAESGGRLDAAKEQLSSADTSIKQAKEFIERYYTTVL